MLIEEKIEIFAEPETVFALYADVPGWPDWDPDTKAASIDGPFVTGATGRLTPTKGFTVPMRFVSVVRNRAFIVESAAPLCVLRFEHILSPTANGVLAVHRVSFSGPLARFYGWLVGSRVRVGLPVTMAKLKRTAEAAGACRTDGQQVPAPAHARARQR